MVSFTPVAQAAEEESRWRCLIVLNLDMQFHLQRRTGALQRIIVEAQNRCPWYLSRHFYVYSNLCRVGIGERSVVENV